MGIFIGGSIPFLVSSITMTAVGDAAFEMIEEIRRQFREIPGLLDGTAEPDNAKCVDIATKAALNKMLLPGAIAILSPIIVGFVLGPVHLGGMLAGALLGCVLMALMMANAGGAWDNAKKFVEKGNFGGKGTETHSATVVGDTVGDPFKDTSGPSMNILIKLTCLIGLVIAPILGGHSTGHYDSHEVSSKEIQISVDMNKLDESDKASETLKLTKDYNGKITTEEFEISGFED